MLLSGFCIWLTFSSGLSHARPLSEVVKSATLRAATEGSFAPFNYYRGRELTGFEIELVNALALKLKLKTQWVSLAFESLFIGLGQDRYDLVAASHAITEDRSMAVDFLEPHYCSGGIIVSKEGGPKTLVDLKGHRVGAQVGSVYPRFLEKQEGVRTLTYPKDVDAFQSLKNGKVDAIVTDRFFAEEASKADPGFKVSFGNLVNPERNAMAVAKGNSSLREALNTTLRVLMRDGTYAKLSQRYFQRDIRCQ